MRALSPDGERRLEAASLSYDLGAPDVPHGYRRLAFDLPVDASLDDARERLLTWRMHEGAGIRVRASAARVAPGVVAVLEPGFGPLRLRAPVRVVDVQEDGFGYGTLPGHPESGEERFTLVAEGDRCRLVVTGFSRPGRTSTRLAGPLARRLQDVVVGRYARALSTRRR